MINQERQTWLKSAGKVLILVCLVSPLASATSVEEIERQFENYLLQQLASVQTDPDKLQPFSTDGCSGGMSQGWDSLAKILPGFKERYGEKPPWEACCIEHDKAYWRGESENGYAKRRAADKVLEQCVRETGQKLMPELMAEYDVDEAVISDAFNVTAELMYAAVRVGGRPCSPFPWRWGYGWPACPLLEQ